MRTNCRQCRISVDGRRSSVRKFTWCHSEDGFFYQSEYLAHLSAKLNLSFVGDGRVGTVGVLLIYVVVNYVVTSNQKRRYEARAVECVGYV